ncbi:MAG: hypothetical protein ACR2K2_10160, partial [Mycobacteriales bacterium]
RQSLRVRPSGRQYLDADFDAYAIALEIDGWQHDEPVHRLADLLRDLALSTERRTVVRLPLVVWRWDEAAVLDALEDLFRSRGWPVHLPGRLIHRRVGCHVGSDVRHQGTTPSQPKRPEM